MIQDILLNLSNNSESLWHLCCDLLALFSIPVKCDKGTPPFWQVWPRRQDSCFLQLTVKVYGIFEKNASHQHLSFHSFQPSISHLPQFCILEVKFSITMAEKSWALFLYPASPHRMEALWGCSRMKHCGPDCLTPVLS